MYQHEFEWESKIWAAVELLIETDYDRLYKFWWISTLQWGYWQHVRLECLKILQPTCCFDTHMLLSGEPDYFGRNKISSGGDLSHYSSASLY